MDLITAVAILVQQVSELQVLSNQLGTQAYYAQDLMNRENSVTAINPQVHAVTATMNINITSIQSQMVIVQQAVDRVAELSNT